MSPISPPPHLERSVRLPSTPPPTGRSLNTPGPPQEAPRAGYSVRWRPRSRNRYRDRSQAGNGHRGAHSGRFGYRCPSCRRRQTRIRHRRPHRRRDGYRFEDPAGRRDRSPGYCWDSVWQGPQPRRHHRHPNHRRNRRWQGPQTRNRHRHGRHHRVGYRYRPHRRGQTRLRHRSGYCRWDRYWDSTVSKVPPPAPSPPPVPLLGPLL